MNISKVFEKIATSFETIGYARAASQLLNMSDTQLLSLGLSRQKIQQGRAGLPWTIDSLVIKAPEQAPTSSANQADFHAQTAA
ncbi:MAG: hypothetical protein WBP46_08845 [Thiolinea sp.]